MPAISAALAITGADRAHLVGYCIGEEPKRMTNGHEKSGPAVVAAKQANKAGKPAAEPVERRAGAEGNAGQERTLRTQGRDGAPQGLDRVRQAARQGKETRFTALLHHVCD